MSNNNEYSTKTTLRFREFSVASFAGLSKETGVVICMHGVPMQAKLSDKIPMPDGQRVVGIKGNQGLGKTSLKNYFIAMLGGEQCANAENSEDKTTKGELVFERDNEKYTVSLSKSRLALTVDTKGFKGKVGEPKTVLQNIIGNINLNPMELKNLNGKKQIKWLREAAKWTEEDLQKEADITQKRKDAYAKRTGVNNSIKQLSQSIIASGYYKWDAENSVVLPTELLEAKNMELAGFSGDQTEVQAAFDEAQKMYQKYQNVPEGIATLNNDKAHTLQSNERLEKEIQELERQIALKRDAIISNSEKIATIDSRIEQNKAWLEGNKGIVEQYNQAREALANFGAKVIEKNEISKYAGMVAELDAKSDETMQLSYNIEAYDLEKKQLVKALTPDIEGLELVLEEGIDNAREEGIYYKGKTMAMLSESEIMQMYVALIEHFNIDVLFIENLGSYGTACIQALNDHVKLRGGYVFYTLMSREVDTLTVEFRDELPE